MPRRPAPIHIEVVKRSAYVSGAGAWGLAEALELPRMNCPQRKVLMIPANRVDDFVAFLEHRSSSRRVTVERRS
jgi:hypothetical protein